MAKVLVVHASRHGGTRGIAERIGEVLRREGVDATVTSAEAARDVGVADAYVIGSGVYMGNWLREGTDFLARYQAALATRPVWLFSSGPLPGSTAEKEGVDQLTQALGPVEGPGSGGRRKVEELAAAINVRDHHVFNGAFDPNDPPKAISERIVRMLPAAKGVLPAGDFREWEVIEAWARTIARELAREVAAEQGRAPVAAG